MGHAVPSVMESSWNRLGHLTQGYDKPWVQITLIVPCLEQRLELALDKVCNGTSV